jgi:hypothetical protein
VWREFVSPPVHPPHVLSNLGIETWTLHLAGEFSDVEVQRVHRTALVPQWSFECGGVRRGRNPGDSLLPIRWDRNSCTSSCLIARVRRCGCERIAAWSGVRGAVKCLDGSAANSFESGGDLSRKPRFMAAQAKVPTDQGE